MNPLPADQAFLHELAEARREALAVLRRAMAHNPDDPASPPLPTKEARQAATAILRLSPRAFPLPTPTPAPPAPAHTPEPPLPTPSPPDLYTPADAPSHLQPLVPPELLKHALRTYHLTTPRRRRRSPHNAAPPP